jgi:hypothetical protein
LVSVIIGYDMASWVKKDGWLKGYVKEKSPVIRKEEVFGNSKVIEEIEVVERQRTVIFIPIKCPFCSSRKVHCYGADKPVLYYQCKEKKCKHKFKVLEKDDLAPLRA